MIGISNCRENSQPFKEFQQGEWKCLQPLSHLEAQGSFRGTAEGKAIFFFPAGQWVSLSLLSCPTAAIINKLHFCREEVAETECLKLVSDQQLPWPLLALAKGQGRWWPGTAQRSCGCSTLNVQGKITGLGTSSLLSPMPTHSKAVFFCSSSPQRLSKLRFKCSCPLGFGCFLLLLFVFISIPPPWSQL